MIKACFETKHFGIIFDLRVTWKKHLVTELIIFCRKLARNSLQAKHPALYHSTKKSIEISVDYHEERNTKKNVNLKQNRG